MVLVTRCRLDDDTDFVSGFSGEELSIKESRVKGACAEPESTGKVGRFETTMTLTTSAKKFSLEINRIDWSQKINNSHLADPTTASGRCLAYYGSLKDMPCGNLYKLEVLVSSVKAFTQFEDNAGTVLVELKQTPSKRQKTSASSNQPASPALQWYAKPHATFGPFGKKTGTFEKTQSVCDPDCALLELSFESAGAAKQFVAAMSGEPADTAKATKDDGTGHELDNSIVVFSGMDSPVEQRFKKAVEARGGKVTCAVSGKTTHLVRGALAGSSKVKKAEELNRTKNLRIKIVTEMEFNKIIEA